MSYVAYNGLTSPNQVLEKMVEYIKSRGYSVVQDISDDLNVFDMSSSDGKKFCFTDRTGNYFIVLRSANGTQIFGTNDDPAMDITTPDTNPDYTGVGMTVGEGYSVIKRWYNQYNVPKEHNGTKVYGVFMPMKVDTLYSYTLYCNNITYPTDTLVFSLVKENDTFHQCTHLMFANINKYDVWEGGAIFSGSSIKDLMGDDVKVFEHDVESDKYILPILSSGEKSNTFLRIDIDDAPTEVRGTILWASSGVNNETGKKLSLPIRVPIMATPSEWEASRKYYVGNIVVRESNYYRCLIEHTSSSSTTPTPKYNVEDGDYWDMINRPISSLGNGKIPHYYYLQSQYRSDWGRNVNTLNCITLDMPIFAAVLVDPDVLDNYAAVGTVTGVYFISTLNMQAAGIYEKSYPDSNVLDQVFPMGKRRGVYGFDGIAISQQQEEDGD